MEFELVIVAIIMAVTWLVSLRVWLSNSARAASIWKGRYMTAVRQRRESGGVEDLGGILEGLEPEIRGFVEPLIDQIPREYLGIVKFLIKNPDLVKKGIEFVRSRKGAVEAL